MKKRDKTDNHVTVPAVAEIRMDRTTTKSLSRSVLSDVTAGGDGPLFEAKPPTLIP